jgi:hypothetical protein
MKSLPAPLIFTKSNVIGVIVTLGPKEAKRLPGVCGSRGLWGGALGKGDGDVAAPVHGGFCGGLKKGGGRTVAIRP